MPDNSQPRPADEFFIGWLPLPRSYSRLLRVVAPATVFAVISIGILLSVRQQPTGSGTWEIESVVTVEGFLRAEPYALLRTIGDTNTSGVHTILLVEEGKFGARQRALPLDHQYVRATGTFLHRDDRWMLELSAKGDSLQKIQPPPDLDQTEFSVGRPDSGRRVKLQGEVIDPKCYLGAMKPGGGKTHKACAILCISGGIPPMLAVREAADHETFYLLANSEGSSATDVVLPYVGDLVELEGDLRMLDDLPVLRVVPATIRRL